MSIGEPVPLHVIGAHIRDAALLDVRVCDLGLLQRVVISQFNICREHDEVVAAQTWMEGERAHSEVYCFDAEDIIWLRETQTKLEDVRPLKKTLKLLRAAPSDSVARRVIDEIVRTVAWLTEGVSEKDLRSAGVDKTPLVVRSRQEAMWLAYEMTNEAPHDICCQHFGYRSRQPLLTISQRLDSAAKYSRGVHYRELPDEWVKRVRITRSLIDSNLGLAYRRTTNSPGWKLHL